MNFIGWKYLATNYRGRGETLVNTLNFQSTEDIEYFLININDVIFFDILIKTTKERRDAEIELEKCLNRCKLLQR